MLLPLGVVFSGVRRGGTSRLGCWNAKVGALRATIDLFKFGEEYAPGAAICLFPFGETAVSAFGTMIGLIGAAIGLFTLSVGGLSCCGDSLGACPAAGIEDNTASVATATGETDNKHHCILPWRLHGAPSPRIWQALCQHPRNPSSVRGEQRAGGLIDTQIFSFEKELRSARFAARNWAQSRLSWRMPASSPLSTFQTG